MKKITFLSLLIFAPLIHASEIKIEYSLTKDIANFVRYIDTTIQQNNAEENRIKTYQQGICALSYIIGCTTALMGSVYYSTEKTIKLSSYSSSVEAVDNTGLQAIMQGAWLGLTSGLITHLLCSMLKPKDNKNTA
ncbi:hypothetical protein Noda2021_06210 [Candidatus Dependentiae bacterium Noda2021]|nr:hypothetical protein Noda2021_06210 [Candidatus Dependentiae bacterium Noda2021]